MTCPIHVCLPHPLTAPLPRPCLSPSFPHPHLHSDVMPDPRFPVSFSRLQDGAAKQDDAPVPIMKTAARTPAEEADYATLYTRLKPTHVEPPFQPAPPWYLIQLEPVVATSLCGKFGLEPQFQILIVFISYFSQLHLSAPPLLLPFFPPLPTHPCRVTCLTRHLNCLSNTDYYLQPDGVADARPAAACTLSARPGRTARSASPSSARSGSVRQLRHFL